MSYCLVFFVEMLGIGAIELSYPLGEISFRGFDKQMIMIVQETIGMQDKMITLGDFTENG